MLTGCTNAYYIFTPPIPVTGAQITGRVMDGQHGIAGAQVYLLAASTAGYGSASTSLLEAGTTGYTDAQGTYVLSAKDGSFTIPGYYKCTAATQIYVYAQRGDAGYGSNAAIGELAALGSCPSVGTVVAPIVVNEVTTVAGAYALAGFATDATHVASSGTALAQTGVANAFTNAANLASVATGAALATTPSGTGTVPQATIDTLANMLAACVGSSGAGSGGCTTLLTSVQAGAAPPAETATAAIDIAHGPSTNLTALYGLQTMASPFAPGLTTVPNDLTVGISFAGGGQQSGGAPSIDGSGNVWLTNYQNASAPGSISVLSFSSNGKLLSGTSGYASFPSNNSIPLVGLDEFGSAWFTSSNIQNTVYEVVKVGNSGAVVSGPNGYTGGGIPDGSSLTYGIAIDGYGNAWVPDLANVAEFSNAGLPLSGTGGFAFSSSVLSFSPLGIAVDGRENIWFSYDSGNSVVSVSKLSNAGKSLLQDVIYNSSSHYGNAFTFLAIDAAGDPWIALSVPTAVRNSDYSNITKLSNTGSILLSIDGSSMKLGALEGLAIDGAGNVWVSSQSLQGFIELSNAGTVLSGPSGYTAGRSGYLSGAAVDGSGDLWSTFEGQTNGSYNTVLYEMIGVATPVVTPLSVGVKNNMLGTRP